MRLGVGLRPWKLRMRCPDGNRKLSHEARPLADENRALAEKSTMHFAPCQGAKAISQRKTMGRISGAAGS